MKGNKAKRKAAAPPAEFIWGPVSEPAKQEQQSAAEAAARPSKQLAPGASPQQSASQPGFRPNRRVLQISLTALAVCACGTAVYEFGFAGSSTPQPGHADVQSVASVSALTPSVPSSSSPSSSLSPSPNPDSSGHSSSDSSKAASSVNVSPKYVPAVRTSTAKAVLVTQTPSVAPTAAVTNGPVTISTPTPEVTATAATKVSGSVQCQSTSVEGVWVQSANGGSGWAPWVSSAARSDYATYSYTLPHGGEYSLHVGCGGTTSAWKVAEYSSFYGGTVNDFYCYDESSSSLYTYCARTSS